MINHHDGGFVSPARVQHDEEGNGAKLLASRGYMKVDHIRSQPRDLGEQGSRIRHKELNVCCAMPVCSNLMGYGILIFLVSENPFRRSPEWLGEEMYKIA